MDLSNRNWITNYYNNNKLYKKCEFQIASNAWFEWKKINTAVWVRGNISTGINHKWGTSLYKLYKCVAHFGLKTDIHFVYFGLRSGMVFEGTMGMYERICRFNSILMSKKERGMQIENGFEEFFCLRSKLSNDNIISA